MLNLTREGRKPRAIASQSTESRTKLAIPTIIYGVLINLEETLRVFYIINFTFLKGKYTYDYFYH